jgi:hypothetical protein
MSMTRAEQTSRFTQPIQQLVIMLIVSVLVGAGAWVIHDTVWAIIQTNPLLNGFIAFVFLLGVLTCFWQVVTLAQSVSWIENFVRRRPGYDLATPPRLLTPLASLLRSRGAKMQISASSSRSILESVEARIDEGRDITRYLSNLLVFLGLLGTFYGLATTVPAVVDTIRSLAPAEGETGLDVFAKLMTGLESQLGGMGTAFSSSLLGLAGSLVVGLLELFAGHGQNRFYRELEEWLSSITRLGFSSGEHDSGETTHSGAVLEHMSAQMEGLQTLYTQSDVSRALLEERVGQLVAVVERLAARLEAEPAQVPALERIADGQALIADGQERLLVALTGPDAPGQADAESRMRLRNIDVQLLRILEEMSAGRQESIADLRGDISALTAAIRQLSRGTVGRG